MNTKRIVYIILTILLGILLGIIVFGMLSILFISIQTTYTSLPDFVFWLFILAGAVGGYFLGISWWRIIYIEHRRWKKPRQTSSEKK